MCAQVERGGNRAAHPTLNRSSRQPTARPSSNSSRSRHANIRPTVVSHPRHTRQVAHRPRRATNHLPRAGFVVGTADRLPFPDRSFDVVAQLTMFTSILDRAVRRAAAAEMQRVLAPAGAILWYDFRYPSPFNRDVRPVRLREIRTLF